MTTTTSSTHDQIMAAILEALAPTGATLVAWRSVRAQLPGSWWQQGEALTALFETYEVSVVKAYGVPFVRLADSYDRLAAAAERDRASQTGWPRPNCRDFVAV
jgi:uncharacterized protein YcaQ